MNKQYVQLSGKNPSDLSLDVFDLFSKYKGNGMAFFEMASVVLHMIDTMAYQVYPPDAAPNFLNALVKDIHDTRHMRKIELLPEEPEQKNPNGGA